MRCFVEKGWAACNLTGEGGFTLVEMVLVIVLLSILGLVTSYTMVESANVYVRTVPALDAAYQAQWAVERMKREIRDLKDTASITTFTSTALTFNDTSDNTIAYSLSGTNLTRNGDLLARGVTSLALTYRKSDGTTATTAADLHLVDIDLTVQTGNEPYRLLATVFPRNFSSMIGSGAGGGSGSGPLDVAASIATVWAHGLKHWHLDLISNSSTDVEIASFALSADTGTPKAIKFELFPGGIKKQVWAGATNLPTGTQTLSQGTSADRTIPAGGTVLSKIHFTSNNASGPITYTLVLNFTDGSSSTLVFTVTW